MRSVTWLPPIRPAIVCISAGVLPAAPVHPTVSVAGVDLSVPGRANATASIAADDGSGAVAWGASLPSGATNVYLAVSSDGGRSFGAPGRFNDIDGDASCEVLDDGALYPAVAAAGSTIVGAWTSGRGASSVIHVEVRR